MSINPESIYIITFIGMPDAADKLIIALGLGGSDQNFSLIDQPGASIVDLTSTTRLRRQTNPFGPGRRCPRHGLNGQVCQHLTGEHRACIIQYVSINAFIGIYIRIYVYYEKKVACIIVNLFEFIVYIIVMGYSSCRKTFSLIC